MSGGSDANAFTPLMRQYQAVKAQHPDKILFFRMGDFYEMFGDDAVKAAPVLGIALTSRSHGNSERIPLAGVPYHSADRYLAKLLAHGIKVVVVEQVEDPRTAKGIVKREIVEILTPGTATIDVTDDPLRSLCLAAVCSDDGKVAGVATLDLSTGIFRIDEGPAAEVMERLRVAEPNEVLYAESQDKAMLNGWLAGLGRSPLLTPAENWHFDFGAAQRDLNELFGTTTLEGFGVRDCRQAVTAAGAIVRYLRENHRDKLGHVNRIARFDRTDQMTLDYGTVRNLELVRNLGDGGSDHTLLTTINLCHTGMGLRRLQQALTHPWRSKAPIELRQAGIAELVKNRDLCFALRQRTTNLSDLEKLAGRVGIGRVNPRQMLAIRDGLTTALSIKETLTKAHSPLLIQIAGSIPPTRDLIDRISQAVSEDAPMAVNKGGIIRPGYAPQLDQFNESIREARQYIGNLQKIERERTGIASLKVGFNKVFGYYIEITRANSAAAPKEYIRKQTLVNAERYITPELKEKEELILAAEEKIFSLESELYQELVDALGARIGELVHTAELLAEIDLVSALADLAVERGYCRPEIFEDERLNITNGRHPVIEAVLPAGTFVPNDIHCEPDGQGIMILTGPNMSGKSTYLRQIGLIVILAQIGSFVPADKAQIGLVDRVFTRVGALDNLARGQSTFLVEMIETANILNNATSRSLVLLDEVGRGTSTFDGLSVAWSVVEYIDEKLRCRTVFATHYHELTGMAALSPRVHNCQVAVKRWEDRVIFMHKIIPGGCDDSYGIEVARLAGLPRPTISRAKQILKLLESGKFSQSELGKSIFRDKVQPSLFEAPRSEVENRIRRLDLNGLSPVAAFDLLRQWKDEIDS
ncbi:MAG: DNA mismatch repair protein MutS [candidate division Zixibacteria bacterium]|nr:DNA mismatch repair protein MutS [candidate division Zixibacteria bacterium]